MKKRELAGGAWLVDVAGAALFAWGIATAVAALAQGGAVTALPVAALVAGGLIRAAAVASVHRLAIAGAQRHAGEARSAALRRLVATPLAQPPPATGTAAALAIDHPQALEAFHARFVPARFAAAAAPILVVAVVACASQVAAAILFATLVPFVLAMILAGSTARRASDRQLAATAALSGLFADRVRMLPILRHFGAQDRIARQVRGAAIELAERSVAVLRAAFLSSAVLEFFSAVSVALVAVYCGFALLGLLPFPNPETLDLREAFFALAMAPEFYLPMRRLAAAYHEKQLGDAAQAALAALPAPIESRPAKPFAGVAMRGGRIAWPGRHIGPVDFDLGDRGMLALTGPTGSGKTSLLAAIAGQVALAEGSVTPLRAQDVAWAAQHVLILPGTLRANLALARPGASDAEIFEALRRTGLDSMLAARGATLDLVLDHRGSGLSGGERRRLGLARAILSNRPLLLCDEPTADLDSASAEAIVALLVDLARDRAVIVATHDASVIAAADREIGL